MDFYLYLDKNTFFHRLDPRTKLVLLFVGFAVPWMFSDIAYLASILALIFVWIWAAKAFQNVRRIRHLLIIFVIVSTIMWAFFGRGPTPLWGFISLEGVLYGLAMGLKIDAMTLSGIVFLSTTRNEEISLALTKLGFPFQIGFVFSLAIRLVPLVAGAGTTILQAQRSRGLDIESGNVIQRVKKYVPLIVPMLISTIRSTDALGMALESKGFGALKKRTFFMELIMGKWDFICMLIAVLLFASALYLRLQGFGRSLIVGT